MRRPAAAPPTPFSRFRPFLLPALFVGLLFILLRAGLDAEALRQDLSEGRPDAALARLATAPGRDLPPSLQGVAWWPARAREAAVAELLELPEEDLLEDLGRPTFVHPLDDLRLEPEVIRLREAPSEALVLELRQVTPELLAAEVPWPAGATEQPVPARLLPGVRYTLTLKDGDGAYQALAAFRLLGRDDATEAGIALATAAEFAGGDPHGSQLLVGVVARDRGLFDEAAEIFTALADRPAYAAVAGQLLALTLAEQGLDRTARNLLRGVR